MKIDLRRISAVVVLLGGMSLAVWAIIGPPQDWAGSMWWARAGLCVGGLGLVLLSAQLMFPINRKKDRDADRDPTSAWGSLAGPLDDLF